MKKLMIFMLLIALCCMGLQVSAETVPEPNTVEVQEASNNVTVDPEQVPVETKQVKAARNTTETNVEKNTQDIPDAMAKQADFAFTYIPNQVYKIYCQVERLTDIQMQPGEEVLFIGAGDTARWMVDKDSSGSSKGKQWHIFVKPLKTGITTNLVINTDRHNYHLEIYSTNWHTPIVNWAYPQEERLAIMRQQEEQAIRERDVIALGEGEMTPETLNFKYKISGRNYKWKPELVFDDGSKTYFKMPQSMRSDEAPALFLKNGRDLLLVNYRVKNNYYIADRLFEEAELRIGKDFIRVKKTSN